MARVIFENLTLEQAKELVHWYKGAGEQDADTWFYCHDADVRAPMTDCGRKGGFMEVKGDDVIVYCK